MHYCDEHLTNKFIHFFMASFLESCWKQGVIVHPSQTFFPLWVQENSNFVNQLRARKSKWKTGAPKNLPYSQANARSRRKWRGARFPGLLRRLFHGSQRWKIILSSSSSPFFISRVRTQEGCHQIICYFPWKTKHDDHSTDFLRSLILENQSDDACAAQFQNAFSWQVGQFP